MSVSTSDLNENQRRAVAWGDGPVLVLAGPGSGKTTVLTRRAARLLIEDEDAGVLALTFTDKAAQEMRGRVDALLGRRAERAHLCTFHSYAADILRQHGSHVGLRPDFEMLTLDEDRIALLDEALELVGPGDETIPEDRLALLRLVDRLFADSYEGEEGEALPFVSLSLSPHWLPALFRAYCARLTAANRLDFGALLHFARRLLQTRPAVTRVLRLAWSHFCVDEFQDTNRAQYDFLRALVGDHRPNLFVVADEDQVIYQWNGASPARLNALKDDYGMEVIQLPESYRCPDAVIRAANSLISHNKQRSQDKQPLVGGRAGPGPGAESGVLWYGTYNYETEEAAAIPVEIRRRGLRPSDCAVLARTAKLLENAANALRADGFDAYRVQRKSVFETPALRLLYCVLRQANARHDRDALRRLCVAWKDLAGNTVEIEDVAAGSALVGGDFLRAWCDVVSDGLSDDRLVGLIARTRALLVDRLDILEFIEWFTDAWIGAWLDVGEGDDSGDGAINEEKDTWLRLHHEILSERGRDNATLNLYLQEIDLKSKAPVPSDTAVRCLTIHAAKGLEFKHVFFIGLAEGVCPSFQAVKSGPDSREMEEERRNCFVAITRTQETLMLMRSWSYNGWAKKPSRFIREMGLSGDIVS